MSKMLYTRLSILVILLVAINTSTYGQGDSKDKKNPLAGLPFKERLFLGGDFGLSFGTTTYIRIAPLVGYRVNPDFSVGVSPSYQYWKVNTPTGSFDQSVYGGSTFARYFLFESIFIQSEFEVLNLEARTRDNESLLDRRVNVPMFFVGAGYSQRTANGSGFFIGAFYDLIQDPNSPYRDDLTFRMGGFIGL